MAGASEPGGGVAGLTPADCRLGVTWCICLIKAQFTGVTIRDYQNGYFGRCLFFISNCASGQTVPLLIIPYTEKLFVLHIFYYDYTDLEIQCFYVISKTLQTVRKRIIRQPISNHFFQISSGLSRTYLIFLKVVFNKL